MNSVPEMFDRISPQYDRANRILSLGLDMHWRHTLAHHLPTEKEMSLLDLATGTGDQISALIEKGASFKNAIGIDLSHGMLKIAKEKFAKKPYGEKVAFQHADAENLPFPDVSFDVCTFSFGIRNVQRPMNALAEMLRVTKPNGRCLILEFSRPTHLFRFPYLFYLRHILPHLGGWIAKDPAAYRYLNKTIEQFACGEVFLDWMRRSGWTNVAAIPLLFGSVTLYRGDRA